MLRQTLAAIIRNETDGLKYRLSGLMYLGLAALFLFLASAIGLFSLFLWLSTMVADWQAALLIGSGLLVIAIPVWLTGRSRLRARLTSASSIDSTIHALVDAGVSSNGKISGKKSLGLVVYAAAIGIAIGRNLSK